jgi:trigger factor
MILLILLTSCGKSEINLETCSFDKYIEYYASFIELGEYKNLEYQTLSTTVTNAEIETELQNFLDDNNTYTNDKKSVIKSGDTVNISFTCSVDNQYIDYLDIDSIDIKVGSESTIDNFEETLISHMPGEVYETKITFPDDFEDATIQNKEGILKITINYIKVPEYIELTDDFVSKNSSYKTVEELRENIKSQLSEDKEAKALASKQSEIITKAFNNSTMKDYDKELTANQAAEMLIPIKNMASTYGMSYEDFVKEYYGYDDTLEFERYIASMALTNFRETCLICAIAKKENISVSDEDIEKQIKQLSTTYNVSNEDVKNTYTSNQIKYMALRVNVINFLTN